MQGKKDKMGNKDTTEKVLADYKDVFADIINALVFKGEQRVKPEALENTMAKSMYKSDNSKLHEQERDVVKIWKECNIELAICGIENQTKTEKYMPLRILGYDGASYRSQLLDKKSSPVAVMTIVLYFGTDKKWDEPTHLKDVIQIPDGLDDYINDYKITVFNIAWLTDEEIARFKSDFKIVADFFVQKRKNHSYVPDNKTTIQHLDAMLKLLSVMTGDNRYEEVLEGNDMEGENTMDVVYENILKKGEVKGKAEGKAEGEAQLGKLIHLLLQNNRIEDVKKASVDEEARKKFYKEFGIID